jgi:hypothetical protein
VIAIVEIKSLSLEGKLGDLQDMPERDWSVRQFLYFGKKSTRRLRTADTSS